MPIKIATFMIVVSIGLTACANSPTSETDTNVNHASTQQKLGAMSCFVRYQWFENALVSRRENIPVGVLLNDIHNEYGQPKFSDWKRSAEIATAYVYSKPAQTNKEYAGMGSALMTQCAQEKNIVTFSKKISTCIHFANIAREIFIEKRKGTPLTEARSKFESALAKMNIKNTLVDDVYTTQQDLSTYRWSLWGGCASNLDDQQISTR